MSRVRPFRRLAAAGVAVLAVVALAACSEEADSSDAAGGTLTMVTEVDADSLDPQQLTSTHAAMIMSHLYDTLVVTDSDQAEVHPSLASSWEVSPDGRQYTFHLRDGVTFHSGKPMTAQDVAFTFDRWSDPANASPTAQSVRAIAQTVAVDERTVRVELTEPDNWFLRNLSMPWAAILNSEAATHPDYGSRTADGTGPFKLGDWIPGDRMDLVRNENYRWGPSIFDNPGPAHLAQITVRILPEPATRVAALQAGEAQVIPHGGSILQFHDQLAADPAMQVHVYDLMNVQFGAFKTAKPETADVRVRRAINYAIDRQANIDVAENGLGRPAQGFLHPDMQYFWNGGVYDYDPDRARQLLDEAGWRPGPDGIRERDGMRLSLDVYAGQANEQGLVLAQSDLAQVGVELKLNLVDRTALYDIRRTETPDLNWIWLPYENADVLRTYFTCGQQPSPNRFNFCDEQFDALMQTAVSSQDPGEVTRAYEQAQQMIYEQALAIPMYYRQEFLTASTDVQGIEVFPQYGMAVFKSLDLRMAG
jgi:ABC-type transport system substrate-binding protein